MMKNCWQKEPKNRPTFSQLAEVIEKQIETVVSIDYFNMNGQPECANNNDLINEIIVHANQMNCSEIVRLFNETTQSPPATDGIENPSFLSVP